MKRKTAQKKSAARRRKPVLTTYARKLSTRRLYDLLGALRGPDYIGDDAQALKLLVTARVRSILFGPENPLPSTGLTWSDAPLDLGRIENAKPSIRALKVFGAQDGIQSPVHYLEHLAKAVEATMGHPVWGRKAVAVLAALRETHV